jgi:hypothetical protein
LLARAAAINGDTPSEPLRRAAADEARPLSTPPHAATHPTIHTGPVTELLHVVLRCVGVVLPAVAVWGFAELRGGVPSGDFGTFLGAMALSLLAAAVWSAIDARSAPTIRVSIRWVAVAVVVGVGVALAFELEAPNSSPGLERAAEVFWSSLFYVVPALMAIGVGVAIGAEQRGRR